jgi:hypothetical protein
MISVNLLENVLNVLVFIFVAQKHQVQDSYTDDACDKIRVTMLQMWKSTGSGD